MVERERPGDASISIQEPTDLDKVSNWIRDLLEREIVPEALTRFSRLLPPDQADVIAHLDRESQARLLSILVPQTVGLIIEEMEPAEAVELSQQMEPEQVLDEASPDAAATSSAVCRGMLPARHWRR